MNSIGLLISAIVGSILTLGIQLVLKRIEFKNTKKNKVFESNLEFKKIFILQPVINFLEDQLRHMAKLYNSYMLRKENIDTLKLKFKYSDLPMAEARIKAFADEDLIEKFNDFTKIRLDVGQSIADIYKTGPAERPYKHLKRAIDMASELIVELQKNYCRL